MIKLKRKISPEETPLVDGLYVIHQGEVYQIRLRGSQEVISALGSFEAVVECGKDLVKKYQTAEYMREKLSLCEYSMELPEQEIIRRQYEETRALDSDLQRDWYDLVNSAPVVEEQTKKEKPTRKVKLGIRLKQSH